MKLVVSLVLILLTAADCGPMHVPLGEPVRGVEYSYQRVGEVYYLYAQNARAYGLAVKEICGRHICSIRQEGIVYVIQVQP